MKRTLQYLITIVLVVFVVLAWAGVARSHNHGNGHDISVPAGTNINKSYVGTGRNIDIAGNVNGDVFCASQNVVTSGDITGDVICAAQTIDVTGTVDGSLRIAAQTLNLESSVGRSATVFAQSFSSRTSSRIAKDATITADTITLDGSVGRDATLHGSNVTINGRVDRNVTGSVGKLSIGPSAVVGGRVDYTSNQKADIAPGAQINGEVRRIDPKEDSSSKAFPWLVGLIASLTMLFCALILVLLFPQTFQSVTQVALEHPGQTVLTGLIASILAPVIGVALLLSLIGTPLALIFGLFWFVILLLSGPFAAYFTGRLILSRSSVKNAIAYMMLGAIVLIILYYIPIINILVLLAVLWFGVGMILVSLWRMARRPIYNMEPANKNTKG
ncbi:MAG: hypothetical protein JWO35_359 [Candidatus Saccharibacteria bacterium]|nr:hypothetical protein [Candidatus Saccharibacteria bacterium]